MRRLEQRTLVSAIAVAIAVLAVAGPAFASSSPDPTKVQGELLLVDTDNKTVTIRTAAGTEALFHYTDDTEITGAREGVAGLATMNGARVTVHYVADDGRQKAVKIEVEASE